MPAPALPLFKYQQEWIDDQSPRKFAVKSRQVGYTFIETLYIILFLLRHPKQKWFYLTAKEEVAVGAIEYAKTHCEALNVIAEAFEEPKTSDDEPLKMSISLANGSKLMALLANPRTARGFRGHVTFDEYAHQIRQRELRGAAVPITTWGGHWHILSSPNGKQGEFSSIWTADGAFDHDTVEAMCREGRQREIGDMWSRHFIDIYQAKEQGHPVDLQLAREGCGHEDLWLQEYCGKFLDEAYAWIAFDMIERATQNGAAWGATLTPGAESVRGRWYAGYDVGRFHDRSVLWVNEVIGRENVVQRAMVVLDRIDFDAQERLINDWMPRVEKLSIDCGGLGLGLAERLKKRWMHKVNQVNFSGGMQVQLATEMRRMFEIGALGIADDAVLRADLHSVRRTYSALGNVKFDSDRSQHGHADRFWAGSLALHAADSGTASLSGGAYQSVLRSSRGSNSRGYL